MILLCKIKARNKLIIAGHPVINDPLYNHAVFGPAKVCSVKIKCWR